MSIYQGNNKISYSCNVDNSVYSVPIGTILSYTSTTPPTGFLVCDGSEVSKTTYADLYTIIGDSYGKCTDAGKFKLPDLRDKFLQGANGNLGTSKEAGLPNLTGELGYIKSIREGSYWQGININTGVFKSSIQTVNTSPTATTAQETASNFVPPSTVVFKASDSNSIYGNSDTVQPPSVCLVFIIKATKISDIPIDTSGLTDYAKISYVDEKIDNLDIPEAVGLSTDSEAGTIKTGYKRTNENKYCNPVKLDADGNAYVNTAYASNAGYADRVQDEYDSEMEVLFRSSYNTDPGALAVWEPVDESHNAISVMSKEAAKEWLDVPTVETGTANGTIAVTVNGSKSNIAVKGLGSAAYTDSGSYAAKAHSHSSINNEITFPNYIHSAAPICFHREDLENINEHAQIKYDNTVLNKNAFGYIFTDNIDGGYMNYMAVGAYAEHDFMSYDLNGNPLGSTVSMSAGTVTATKFTNLGGDYAEYWEWEDGNTENEDRVGYFVTFHKNKIRLSANGDHLSKVGVVSATPSIIGDSDNKEWKQKYAKDIFGRVLYEDVEDENGKIIHRMKLNPEYDETQTYIKRKDRPEWNPIGTHGKLVVIDDGSCVEDGFCKPTDGGIATASDDGFYVMERLDENHIRIYIK